MVAQRQKLAVRWFAGELLPKYARMTDELGEFGQFLVDEPKSPAIVVDYLSGPKDLTHQFNQANGQAHTLWRSTRLPSA